MKKQTKKHLKEEFSIKMWYDSEYVTLDIEQNNFSIPLILKSLFIYNSGLIYLNLLINCFQKLKVSTTEGPIFYSGFSHSITFYCLKLLEKKV